MSQYSLPFPHQHLLICYPSKHNPQLLQLKLEWSYKYIYLPEKLILNMQNQQLLSKIANNDKHGENSPYFDGLKAYDRNPFHPKKNPQGVIQMGLAENQVCVWASKYCCSQRWNAVFWYYNKLTHMGVFIFSFFSSSALIWLKSG